MMQLVVSYLNGQTYYYPVIPEQGWRIESSQRCLVIGRGVPRIYIPLDTVASFTIEDIKDD